MSEMRLAEHRRFLKGFEVEAKGEQISSFFSSIGSQRAPTPDILLGGDAGVGWRLIDIYLEPSPKDPCCQEPIWGTAANTCLTTNAIPKSETASFC